MIYIFLKKMMTVTKQRILMINWLIQRTIVLNMILWVPCERKVEVWESSKLIMLSINVFEKTVYWMMHMPYNIVCWCKQHGFWLSFYQNTTLHLQEGNVNHSPERTSIICVLKKSVYIRKDPSVNMTLQ